MTKLKVDIEVRYIVVYFPKWRQKKKGNYTVTILLNP